MEDHKKCQVRNPYVLTLTFALHHDTYILCSVNLPITCSSTMASWDMWPSLIWHRYWPSSEARMCWISRATAPLPMESPTNSVLPRYPSICSSPCSCPFWYTSTVEESWARYHRICMWAALCSGDSWQGRLASAPSRTMMGWAGPFTENPDTAWKLETNWGNEWGWGAGWDGRPPCIHYVGTQTYFSLICVIFWPQIKETVTENVIIVTS